MTVTDLTGQRFGRLLVVSPNGTNLHGRAMWLALCDCGRQIVCAQSQLRSGKTRSCGCLRKEVTAERSRAAALHGEALLGRGTKEYRAWKGMIYRCDNPRASKFSLYGGRGIRVAPEWRHDFPAFLKYMGRAQSPHHSIDRIDVNGNYEPGNVRWADRELQAQNKERGLFVVFRGERVSVAALARQWGIGYRALTYRLRKGIPPEDAVQNYRPRARS